MDFWPHFFGLLGTVLVSSTALLRFSLVQQRTAVDRLIGFLERSMRRQEELNERFQATLESLDGNVRENSNLIGRISERLDFAKPPATRTRNGP